jgi:3-hydroxymyristoyl/3-hydroxydecanoyl-(acyl carrier protein) dehydratase
LELTDGTPSKVWGEQYKPLDGLIIRARLPLPPFMFVGRITGLDAEFGQFRPSRIDMEYDISDDCIMMISKNTISYILMTEASHVAILLLAYIGIDMIYEEGVSYRILNTEDIFYSDFPTLGDTIQATLEFVNFQKSGGTTLVTSKFSCSSNGELIMTMELTGGFFTAQALNSGKGIISKRPLAIMSKPKDSIMRPKEKPITDMEEFFNGVHGPFIYPKRSSLTADRLYVHPHMRMVDRIISMEFEGGEYGLGKIVAEKDIDENYWAFERHFKNDPVFPGSLLAEAANQILLIFSLNAGLFDGGAFHLSNSLELHIKSVFRRSVRPEKSVIRFDQNFKEVSRGADGSVTVVADCDVFWKGIHVVRTEDVSLVICRIGNN